MGGEGRLGNHWQEDDSDPVGDTHRFTPRLPSTAVFPVA